MWIRDHLYGNCKIATALLFGFSVITALSNSQKEFNEQVLLMMHFGSLLGSFALATLAIKLKLRLADYAMFLILAVRSMETFLVFHLIDTSAPGFTLIDKKELADAISFIAAPCQILAISNFRFNYLVTNPLTTLGIFLVN